MNFPFHQSMKSMPKNAVGHQLVRQIVVGGGHPNHLMWHVAFACLDVTVFRHPSARISEDPDEEEGMLGWCGFPWIMLTSMVCKLPQSN